MRRIPKIAAILLLLSFLLTACRFGKENSPEDVSSEIVSSEISSEASSEDIAESSETSSIEESSSETSSQSSSSETSSLIPVIKTVNGTVVETDNSLLTIKTENNTVMRFSFSENSEIAQQNLLFGDLLTVSYDENSAENGVYQIHALQNHSEQMPDSFLDGGIFEKHYQKAYSLLRQMSVEETVGQLFLIRCPESDVEKIIQTYHPGGLVLFGRDFKNRSFETVQQNIRSYQNASRIPLIVSVDEEGGSVVRISQNPQFTPSRFLSPQELYEQGGLQAIREDAINKADLLLSLGINVNLAPVADISTDPEDYIYKRTLGRPASETAQYISEVVEISQSTGLSCTLKHFPGYGNNLNTHTGISIDKRSLESFRENDFLPFQAGIRSGVHGVMVSHNIITCVDDALPASLSPKIHQILRDELHFTGIIFTDDLSMDAIKKYVSGVSPAVQAVLCGNDLLTSTGYEEEYPQVLKAVKDGTIPIEQLRRAVVRILAWKMEKGLL